MELFGVKFNIIRMKLLNKKFGMSEAYIFYKRIREICYVGLFSFPYKKGAAKSKIKFPEYMKEMIDSITFNENPFNKVQT